MKSFSKKSVALIILTVILFGFSSFGIAKAEIAKITYVDQKGITFTYQGNSLWLPQGVVATSSAVTSYAMLTDHEMPDSKLAEADKYDADVSSSGGTSIWSKITNGLKTGANIAIGLYESPTFILISITLFTIGAVAAGVLGLAGILFDQAVQYSLFGFHDLFSGLNSIWALFRDTINVLFIFILLYIAIKKIIGSSGFDEKKALGNLIVNAILINFSLFISRFIIDVGNIFAVAFYNNITVNGTHSISTIIFSNLHLSSLFSWSLLSITGQANMIMLLLLRITLVVIAAYVFFYAAFMFIGRAVMLVYLGITSPIAFVGGTIPTLKSHAENWKKEFGNQVLVAPVFLLFILIISRLLKISVLQDVAKASTTGSVGDFSVAGYFYFALIIILLLKALKETKDLSGKVADSIITAAKGAVAVGALAIPGGAVAGGGFLSSAFGKAAVASAEGKTGLSAIGARLAFTSKEVAGGTGRFVKKFAEGGFEKEPGFVARGLTAARENINAGIKSGTEGRVDLINLQKILEKTTKENEKKIMEAAEAVGPQKARDAKKQLETTRENVENQAEERLANEEARLEKELKGNLEILSKAVGPTQSAEAQAKVNSTQAEIVKFKTAKDEGERLENQKKAYQKTATDTKKDKSATDADKTAAQADVDAADAAIDKFKKAQLKPIEEKVAKEMGIAGTTLADGTVSYVKTIEEDIKKTNSDIIEGLQKRNEFIVKTAAKAASEPAGREYFGYLQSRKDREKVIAKLRAQKGKYNADKGNIVKGLQKLIKESGEETGEKPAESKPKEGGGESRAPGGGL